MSDIIYETESYEIQGAIFDVYRELGCGFLEAVYQEALLIEFTRRGIPYIAQPELRIMYKGVALKQVYRPDILCFDSIVIELKAVKSFSPEHRAQILNYLKVTDFRLGLLVNFGAFPKVDIARVLK